MQQYSVDYQQLQKIQVDNKPQLLGYVKSHHTLLNINLKNCPDHFQAYNNKFTLFLARRPQQRGRRYCQNGLVAHSIQGDYVWECRNCDYKICLKCQPYVIADLKCPVHKQFIEFKNDFQAEIQCTQCRGLYQVGQSFWKCPNDRYCISNCLKCLAKNSIIPYYRLDHCVAHGRTLRLQNNGNVRNQCMKCTKEILSLNDYRCDREGCPFILCINCNGGLGRSNNNRMMHPYLVLNYIDRCGLNSGTNPLSVNMIQDIIEQIRGPMH